MKIAFYLFNKNINTVDCRDILNGNPGFGGSQYAVILTAYLLSIRNNGLDVVVYALKQGLFPSGLHVETAENLDCAVKKAIQRKVSVMAVDWKHLDDSTVLKYAGIMKFIVWAHNFIPLKSYNFYDRQSNVVRIVHVGREQCDLCRDHPAFYKSDYIYNGISVSSIDKYLPALPSYESRSNNVAYIGSIIPAKGFHVLAKIWKTVLKSIPDANLYVVGTGKLYGRDVSLGAYGIADNNYEKEFMPYLLDEYGRLLQSVHFMGIMGLEKNDLLMKCKVGVPNPSGNTETFGFTAVEMQAMGCLVATMRCPGYLDTVAPNSILYTSTSQLAKSIINLLRRTENDYRNTYNFIREKFDCNHVISQWEKLFENCGTGNRSHLHPISELVNPNYRCKKLKENIRRLKKTFSPLRILPPTERLMSLHTSLLIKIRFYVDLFS